MTEWIEDFAMRHWREWTGRSPRRLTSAILTSSRHRHQRFTLILADGLRRPEVVAKVSADPQHSVSIRREFSALRAAERELPERFTNQMPRAFHLAEESAGTALFCSAMPGKRLLVPPLLARPDRRWQREFADVIAAVLRWTAELSRLTRTSRADTSGIIRDSIGRFPEFGSDISALARIEAPHSWQHGDVAVGNILKTRQDLGLIDWEHASPTSLPWHDRAYVVLATGLLAAHQAGVDPVTGFDALYAPDSWCGDLVRLCLEDTWDQSVEVAPAVHLTALSLAAHRTDAQGAWPKLARHLIEQRGPVWLRT